MSVNELYSLLVLEFGIYPKYVLDEMQYYEIKSLMKNSYHRNKENWEQARLITYMIAQTNSKKKMKLQDIVKFPWETESESTKITTEEINELARQAAAMEAILNENNN